MTTDSAAPATSTIECVPSLIAQLLHATYPEELAVLGIPICCINEIDLWAVPVRFCCGTYHVAFCRLEAGTVHLIPPPDSVAEALPHSTRLPSLIVVDGALQIVVHTDQGDRCFPF